MKTRRNRSPRFPITVNLTAGCLQKKYRLPTAKVRLGGDCLHAQVSTETMKNYRTSKQVVLAYVTVFPPAVLTMEAGHPLQESPIYPFFHNHISVANPSVQRNKIILKFMGNFPLNP